MSGLMVDASRIYCAVTKVLVEWMCVFCCTFEESKISRCCTPLAAYSHISPFRTLIQTII